MQVFFENISHLIPQTKSFLVFSEGIKSKHWPEVS